MKKYRNLNGDSGVTHYQIGEDFIRLKFWGSASTYTYNYRVTGKSPVEHMKMLAENGQGLSAYIAQHPDVRERFSELR